MSFTPESGVPREALAEPFLREFQALKPSFEANLAEIARLKHEMDRERTGPEDHEKRYQAERAYSELRRTSNYPMREFFDRAGRALGIESLYQGEPADEADRQDRDELPYNAVRLGHDINLLQTNEGISVKTDAEIEALRA